MDLIKLEATLWEKIRESQDAGRPVRNGLMVYYFGGRAGRRTPPLTGESTPVCLLGAAAWPSSEPFAAVERDFGLTYSQASALEAGFENWLHYPNGPHAELYEMGSRIGMRLLKLEELAQPAKPHAP